MPRASLSMKDAVDVSFGIQEGVVEVTKATVKIHQFPPNKTTGEQGDPFPCVQLTVVRCDESGARVSDDEITEELGIGKLEKFHPGKASGPDDEDPEDLGTEVDTEGNCVFVPEGGGRMNKNSKWIRLADSLESKGFKSEVLGRGYMPDLIGLKVKMKTLTLPRTPGYTGKNDPTALVAEKILVFPYEKKAAGKTAKATAGKPATAPAPAKASGGSSAEEMALKFMGEVATEYAGKEIERKKLQTAVQTKLMRGKVPVPQHKPVLDLVKSDDWLRGVTSENEDSPIYGQIMVDFDADPQTVTFATAD